MSTKGLVGRLRHVQWLAALAAVVSLSACGGGCGGLDFDDLAFPVDVRSAVAHGGGRFVSTGTYGIRVSNDGATFTTVTDDVGLPGFFGQALTFGPEGWLILSGSGFFTSDDGFSWTPVDPPADEVYAAAAAGAGLYVIAGRNGAISVSADCTSWTRVESRTTEDLLAAAFVEGRFVAVGRRGTALTSPDGLAWSPLAPPTAVDLTGIAGANGVLLLTGVDGTILRSTDGSTWAPIHSGTRAHLAAATFGAGRFVVVGAGRTVLTSPDGGVTFSGAVVDYGSAPPDARLSGVAYGDGVFVAVGDAGIVSPDGVAWTSTLLVPELPPEDGVQATANGP